MELRSDQASDPAPTAASDDRENATPYTGVVVIHGLGDAKRNDFLLEGVNALTNWFNHKAGLPMHPTGRGRVWLTTQLVEDADPDAPASRATIEIAAPGTVGGDQQGDAAPLQIRFREVWWAQSFGTQSFATTIRWARVQFAEQMSHILVPVSWRYRFARTGAPATAQVVASQPNQPARANARRFRPLLHVALGVYALIQYAWKAAQWLALTPILMVVLLLMAVLRVLSFIGIIKSALAASFSALSGYIMLHWIASTEIYLRDYARAATIRGRFEREFNAFLHDARCERIVVIAHSMGTVIAYEALTLLRDRGEAEGSAKPITFICLAQALRRVWLLPGIDARRLYGTLPERVRWLNFWARYDPIPAGPLSIRALPPLDARGDASLPNAYAQLSAGLERCKNFITVNTDSSFTDHTTYWQNDEQVVGPIARELVAGHPAMEHVVASYLATREDVLLRRWDVAWRYSLALAGGLAASVGVLVWLILSPGLVEFVTGLVRSINWTGLLLSVCPACQPLTTLPAPQLPSTVQAYAHYVALWYVLGQVDILAVVVSAILVLGAGTLGLQAAGQIVTRPSPLTAQRASALDLGGTRWVFVLSALTVLLVLATSLVFSAFVGKQAAAGQHSATPTITTFLLLLAMAECAAGLAFWVGIFAQVAYRQWIWIAWMFLTVLLLLTYDAFMRTALLGLVIASCLILLVRLARARQTGWYWAIAVQLMIILYLGFATLAANLGIFGLNFGTGIYVDVTLPAFVYGLWSLPVVRARARAHTGRVSGGIFALAAVYLALVYVILLTRFGSTLVIFPGNTLTFWNSQDLARTSARFGTLFLGDPRAIAAELLALLALALGLYDAARHRRWGWTGIILLALGALAAGFVWLRVVIGASPALPDDALTLSLVPLTAALIYGLWAGAPGGKPAVPSRERVGTSSHS